MGVADWGVQERWQDAQGTWHDVSPETVAAVLDAMRTGGEGRPPAGPALFVRPGDPIPLDGAADLLWSLTSQRLWEELVIGRGWGAERYRTHVTYLAASALTH